MQPREVCRVRLIYPCLSCLLLIGTREWRVGYIPIGKIISINNLVQCCTCCRRIFQLGYSSLSTSDIAQGILPGTFGSVQTKCQTYVAVCHSSIVHGIFKVNKVDQVIALIVVFVYETGKLGGHTPQSLGCITALIIVPFCYLSPFCFSPSSSSSCLRRGIVLIPRF